MKVEVGCVKKWCDIVLVIASIDSLDIEIEAARAQVCALRHCLVANIVMLNAVAVSLRLASRRI